MPFPSSGAVSLSALKSYFTAYTTTGYTGNNLSDYYRGRLVPNDSLNSGVPTSGAISFSQLRGAYRNRSVVVNFVATTTAGGNGWQGDQSLFDGMRATLMHHGAASPYPYSLAIETSSSSMPSTVSRFYEFRLMNSSGGTLWTNSLSSYSSQPMFRVYSLGNHGQLSLGTSYRFSISWIE